MLVQQYFMRGVWDVTFNVKGAKENAPSSLRSPSTKIRKQIELEEQLRCTGESIGICSECYSHLFSWGQRVFGEESSVDALVESPENTLLAYIPDEDEDARNQIMLEQRRDGLLFLFHPIITLLFTLSV